MLSLVSFTHLDSEHFNTRLFNSVVRVWIINSIANNGTIDVGVLPRFEPRDPARAQSWVDQRNPAAPW